jgi:hypothetical protein
MMASLHNQLRRTPFSRALKQALGDTREQGGLERYGETLTALIDLWSQPDWAILREEQLWARVFFSPAVVGELSACAITLPVGSSQIVTVDGAVARAGVATVGLGLAPRGNIAVTLTQGTNAIFRDSRWLPLSAGSLTSSVECWTGSDGAALGSLQDEIISEATDLKRFFSLPVVLGKTKSALDMSWWVQCQTVNTSLDAVMWGRVRNAVISEPV